MYDYIIIGAGWAGAVMAERIAKVNNEKVLVLEKRDHIAGNMYDYYNEAGVLVHKYGPHIFHTNNQQVWEYVNTFGPWRHYEHEVLGELEEDHLLPIPFNLNTLYGMYSKEEADYLKEVLTETYGMETKVPILELRQNENKAVQDLAELVYEKVFLHYTMKQWGLTPEELDPQVTGRVPVYISYDNRYFQDEFQGLPQEGYTKIFEQMLDHPNIEVRTSVDALSLLQIKDNKVFFDNEQFMGKVIFTGQIDELFNFSHGELPYRSLHFVAQTLNEDYHFPVGTVNFPNRYEYTRISEFKYLTGQKIDGVTTIMEEYPQPYDRHIEKQSIPYYPIPKDDTEILYNKYQEEAKQVEQLLLLGRLAQYKYYNMDAIIAEALKVFDERIKK